MKTEEETKEIIRLYTEKRASLQEIANLFSCSRTLVRKILTDKLIPIRSNRKHNVDFYYFQQINSQEKAYVLGLLCADGNNKGNGFSILLHERDKDILEVVKKQLGYESDLYQIKRFIPYESLYYCLNVTSKEIANDLTRLGCVPKKSLVLKFPTKEQVPLYLVRHFIRGYMDGDGSIYYSKDYNTNLIGTKEFLSKVQEIIQDELDIKPTPLKKRHPNSNTNTYEMRISGHRRVFKYLNWLYQDSCIQMDRKFKKYREFVDFYTQFLSNQEERKNRMCVKDGCDRQDIWGRGLCRKCYQYSKRKELLSLQKL